MVDKPIIYLYPTKETNISIKLLNENKITHSYPIYKDEWKVIAKPNGDLVYLQTNKKLYSLYYESKRTIIKQSNKKWLYTYRMGWN